MVNNPQFAYMYTWLREIMLYMLVVTPWHAQVIAYLNLSTVLRNGGNANGMKENEREFYGFIYQKSSTWETKSKVAG